jgi:hypothetical protein
MTVKVLARRARLAGLALLALLTLSLALLG